MGNGVRLLPGVFPVINMMESDLHHFQCSIFTRARFHVFRYNRSMANKKRFWWGILLGFGALIALYAVTRLLNLTKLPIFTDEAIYIRWSQIGMRDPNWRFISLTDGKQPMFTWVMMVLLKVLKGVDPLFVGRLTSVVAGIGTLIGVCVLSWELFRDRRVSWFTGVLYVIIPFTLWYDRMAIYDSMVSLFSVWSLYLAVLLVRKVRLDIALLLGMVLGCGMLNKSSGFLSLYAMPLTLILFDWRKEHRFNRLARWAGLVIVSAVLSQVFYSVLRLSPFFHIVSQKDNVFIFSPREWLNQPFRFFAGNLKGMFDWLRNYLTLPVFVVTLVPLFTRWGKARERWLLYVWWAMPFAALANFAKILYPRFTLFMTIPLLLVAAESFMELWDMIKRPLVRLALVVLLLSPAAMTSYMIVTNPIAAPIPLSDQYQYMNDWPAGGGVPEVVSYLREQVRHEKINVYTEGTFGLMPYSIEIYLVDNPNIKIKGIWPLPNVIPDSIQEEALSRPTYLILNESQVAPAGWPLALIGEYQKGNRTDRKLRFYRVTAPRVQAL